MEVIGSKRNKMPLARWKIWCYNYNDNKTHDGRSKGCRAFFSHIPVEKYGAVSACVCSQRQAERTEGK